jgi:hypothetical protein
VKETHKLSLNAYANYSEQRYSYAGINSTYILRSQSVNGYYVHSLNDHWSAGGFGYAERSDFSNYDLFQSYSGAVEYNFVPYNEAQTRMITLAYRAGINFYDFQEETIFNKTKDAIPYQVLNAQASFTQDWGSFSAGFEASAFINDFEKNHLNLWLSSSVRIFKGLSVNTYLQYQVQRDQVNIRLNGASAEEVLLQQQELLSDFNAYGYVSLNYRFGSIYNNVVNPRFNY